VEREVTWTWETEEQGAQTVQIVTLTINQASGKNGSRNRGDVRGWCGHHFNTCGRWYAGDWEANGGFNQWSVTELKW
jgi:hypothetical protein